MHQKWLGNLPMDENSAREFALQIIREEIGTIPFGGDPYLDGEKIWTVPILVNYPKVHFDNVKKAPKRLRFLHFGRVGRSNRAWPCLR